MIQQVHYLNRTHLIPTLPKIYKQLKNQYFLKKLLHSKHNSNFGKLISFSVFREEDVSKEWQLGTNHFFSYRIIQKSQTYMFSSSGLITLASFQLK